MSSLETSATRRSRSVAPAVSTGLLGRFLPGHGAGADDFGDAVDAGSGFLLGHGLTPSGLRGAEPAPRCLIVFLQDGFAASASGSISATTRLAGTWSPMATLRALTIPPSGAAWMCSI